MREIWMWEERYSRAHLDADSEGTAAEDDPVVPELTRVEDGPLVREVLVVRAVVAVKVALE